MAVPTANMISGRFHAIVSARPLHGNGPPVIHEEAYRPISYESWSGTRHQNGKRVREPGDAGPSTSRKAAKKTSEDETGAGREPTTQYRDRDGLLSALGDRFCAGPNVDFHGTYEILDSGVTHKERIQTVAHEIWKTTGYRFTVKDHPQYTNGHKTRFWCSQDEAHRSKSSRAARKAQGSCYKPRVTSAGEAMAKERFACRSRLLISSRDTHQPGARLITIRMHHHVSHEPYIDSSMSHETINRIWQNFGYGHHSDSSTTITVSNKTENDVTMDHIPLSMPPEDEDDEGDDSSEADGGTGTEIFERRDDSIRQPTFVPTNHIPNNHVPNNHIPQQPPLPPPSEEFHSKMKAHIKNLREFCEGLEYQLQFNDYRMLDVLEREGGSFLGLVEDCLRKEGRLASVDQPSISQQQQHQQHQQQHQQPYSGTNPSLHSIRLDMNNGRTIQGRPYDGNPGINPRALNY